MHRIFNNWKVVLLSVIGATTFWFFNALNKNYEARISYPVEFLFDRDSVVVMQPLASTVDIDVSSGGWNLLRKTFWFNVTPIQISLDNPTEIGFYTRNSLLPIVSDQLSELKINYLATDTVYIDIEAKKQKRVVLKVDSMAVDLAENHRITSPISISPDTVLLVGPKSFIDTIGATYQLDIVTRGISNDFKRDVTVNLPEGDLAQSKPEKVRVAFEVEKFERQSIEIVVEPQNFPSDSSAYLSRATVQVFYTVSEQNKKDFTEDDFVVTADYNMLDERTNSVLAILVYSPDPAIEIEVIPENIPVRNVQ